MSTPLESPKDAQYAPIKIQVIFESAIMFLNKLKNQDLLKTLGSEYCLFTLQIILNEEAYCSENILSSKKTNLIPPTKIDKDRFGNLIDPLKHKMTIDPSNFIDLSSNTIMPVFNENSFIFFLNPKDFIDQTTLIHFEIYLNLSLAFKYSLDISRYIN